MADKIKLWLAGLLVIAGVVGFYLLRENVMVLRVASVLAGLGAAAAVAWTSEDGKRFFQFGRESWIEAQKVSWPTRKETLQTTAVVMGFVVVMAIFLWIIDASLMSAVKLLMGRGD